MKSLESVVTDAKIRGVKSLEGPDQELLVAQCLLLVHKLCSLVAQTRGRQYLSYDTLPKHHNQIFTYLYRMTGVHVVKVHGADFCEGFFSLDVAGRGPRSTSGRSMQLDIRRKKSKCGLIS